MAVFEVKSEPTAGDLRGLAAAWALFFAVVAGLAWWSPGALAAAAAFTQVCFVLFVVLERETGRAKLWGLLFPVIFLSAWWGAEFSPGAVGIAALATGLAGGVAALGPAGRSLYRAWMHAALPAGWVMSHVLLGIVFYGVLTPIGLLLRLMGRDLLGLKMDRGAASYWRVRGPGEGAGRYFRQW